MTISTKQMKSRDLSAKGFIYRVTNLVNGLVYIGLTTRTPDERWRGHQREAKRGSGSPLHKAIRFFGKTSFRVETLMEATVAELPELERSQIDFHKSDDPERGYNACRGGGLGGPTLGHEVEFGGKKFLSRKAFSDYVGVKYELVRKMFSEGKSPEEIAVIGRERTGTGSQLKKEIVVHGVKYPSVGEACKALGVARYNVNYRLRSGWSLEDAFNPEVFTKTTAPSAGAIEFDGVVYPSMTELAKKYGVTATTVNRRVNKLGWSLERALSSEKFTRKGVKNRSTQC